MSGMHCRGLKGWRGFAAGGLVSVPGASTSGVADDIHVDDAPVGAFVLPADSVRVLRETQPELLAQILAAIQQAGDGGGQTAQIAISNGELFIPPAAVEMLGGAEVLNAIKDATHTNVAAPAAKPLDAPPPPGGVNAPLDAVVQPPRGLPGVAGAVLPDAAMPGSGQAQQQRTFFMDGGEVDDERRAWMEQDAATARKRAEQMDVEAQERMQQEMKRDAAAAEQQAMLQEQENAERARRQQLFSQPAGLPGFGGQVWL